jgi:hypothetical protein
MSSSDRYGNSYQLGLDVRIDSDDTILGSAERVIQEYQSSVLALRPSINELLFSLMKGRS